MREFGEIDMAAWEEWVKAGCDARLIDVRTPAEAARGVIPGAEQLPLHQLPLRAGELGGERPVVLYCRSGARSAQGCGFLAARGHDNIYNLSGGIQRWVAAGKPIVVPDALAAEG